MISISDKKLKFVGKHRLQIIYFIFCKKNLKRAKIRLMNESPFLVLNAWPTFVSAHTFCASRKAWSKWQACAGVNIDAANKMKAIST